MPTVYVQEDFESGTFTAGGWSVGPWYSEPGINAQVPNYTTLVPPGVGGTYAAFLNDSFIALPTPSTGTGYTAFRFWAYVYPDICQTSGMNILSVGTGGSAYCANLYRGPAAAGTSPRFQVYGGAGVTSYTTPTFVVDPGWHSFQIIIQPQNANGTVNSSFVNVLVDGHSVAFRANAFALPAPGGTMFYGAMPLSGADGSGTQKVVIDNIKVADGSISGDTYYQSLTGHLQLHAVTPLSHIARVKALTAQLKLHPVVTSVRFFSRTLTGALHLAPTLRANRLLQLLATVTATPTLGTGHRYWRSFTGTQATTPSLGKRAVYRRTLTKGLGLHGTLSPSRLKFQTLSAALKLAPNVHIGHVFQQVVQARLRLQGSVTRGSTYARTLTAHLALHGSIVRTLTVKITDRLKALDALAPTSGYPIIRRVLPVRSIFRILRIRSQP